MNTPTEAEIENATKDLTHTTDGPVTDFVILSRMAKLAASGAHTPEALANAAHNELGFHE